MSSETFRVVEGLPGGSMRCGEAGAPLGSMQGSRVLDPAAVGQALRQLIARSEITTSRALIAAGDGPAFNRCLAATAQLLLLYGGLFAAGLAAS